MPSAACFAGADRAGSTPSPRSRRPADKRPARRFRSARCGSTKYRRTPGCAARSRSCVEIRYELAFQSRDLIFEQQLAPLEAFHLQLVHLEVHAETGDDVVEIAMLDAQLAQALDVLEQIGIDVVLFVTHVYRPKLRHTGVMRSGSLRERPRGFQAAWPL